MSHRNDSKRAADLRYETILFIVACVLYASGRAPFFGQWDSFDYLKQIATHQLSDLGFGRPFFIAYNILLWEAVRRLFRLGPLDVDSVVMAGVVLAGAAGVLVFWRFARRLSPGLPARMAALALLLSPMYATYSGFIMTEVPMILMAVAAALVLWDSDGGRPLLREAAGGCLFGIAVGIREQAITLGAAYLWILWVRRAEPASRLRAWIIFGVSAFTVIAAPVLAIYLHDAAWFVQRTRIWLHTIPMEDVHFTRNLEATLLYTLAVCPAAWLGLFGAGLYRWYRGRKLAPENPAVRTDLAPGIPHPCWGAVCCILIPIAVLWRDADVQIHPRYALIALPGILLLCTTAYCRWFPTRKAAAIWAVLQLVVFGAAQIGIQPLRQFQREKREFARLTMKTVPDSALIIAGGYSPILDYYRGIGERPRWHVLWSGWGWDAKSAESTIRTAWKIGQPVYWCDGPYGWLYFEEQWLDVYFILKGSREELAAPGIRRIFPPDRSPSPFSAKQ